VSNPASHPSEAQTHAGEGPYPSFSALRDAHLALRKRCSPQRIDPVSASIEERPDAETIRALVARVRATGTILDDPDERRAAQGILDHWCIELVSLPKAAADFLPMLLAPYDAATRPISQTDSASVATPKTPTAAPHATFEINAKSIVALPAENAPEARSRQLVRLAAAARLWRDSGKQDGYLLWGDKEIEAAAQHAPLDPDIAALVEASRKGSTRYLRMKYGFLSGVTVTLVVILGFALWKWWDASAALDRLSAETRELSAAQVDLDKALADESLARNTVRTNAESADQVQHRLDLALATLRTLHVGGRLPEADLPKELVPFVAARVTASVQEPSVPAALSPAQYDAQFLDAWLPLPGAAPPHVRADFTHFSVALDPNRRLAVAAASNLDRDKRLVLPRRSISLVSDPRIPAGVQPDPAWFRSPQIDIGHLVSRREISWGDDPAAAENLIGIANALPNVAPQFDVFNSGVWADLENWVLTEHNRAAARVSVLTGPVLTANDPVIEGVSMPRSFWKVAVSRNVGGPGLVIDAFLVSQFKDGGNQKAERVAFEPARFRVTVSEIERRTGLDFGATLRGATNEAQDNASPAPKRPPVTVLFRFAGIKREDATALSDRLKALDWKILGEERTGAAANQMEVRYGQDADAKAAEKLAEDLKSLGLKKIAVKNNLNINGGVLEVWVSR